MTHRNEDARTPASAWGTPRTFILNRITPRMWLANQTAAAGWDVVQKTADMINASPGAGLISAIGNGQFNMSHEHAQAVLKELGYVASSVERQGIAVHGQEAEGCAFQLIPNLENALLVLGDRLGRAPRDDAETTWVLQPHLSFTRSDGEARFADAARFMNEQMGVVADMLQPIRDGHTPFASSVGVLAKATEIIRACREKMAGLAKDAFPKDFGAMRDHLVPLTVGGVLYEPPNATYLPSWNRVDAAIGIYDERWLDAIPGRIKNMPLQHRELLIEEMGKPTISDILADFFGARIDGMSLSEIGAEQPDLMPAVAAANALAKEHGAMLHGVHVGAIRKNLPEGAAGGHGAPGDANLHAQDKGVSGRSVSETDELRAMRVGHWLTRLK